MTFIGTSGWSYNHWNDILYPPGTRPWERLNIYTRHFSTVELNSSFYRWPSNTLLKRWNNDLPQHFLLSVKAPSLLTHVKRLYQPESWILRIKNAWHELRDKRAVLLIQLSPLFTYDHARLAYFLEVLPSWIRTAVEFRHPSWHREEIYRLLEMHGAAYCVISGAQLPCHLVSTTSFVYVRMHGPDHSHLYGGSYPMEDLRWWRDRVKEWSTQGKDVFVYFNNDGYGNAVRNAAALQSLCC